MKARFNEFAMIAKKTKYSEAKLCARHEKTLEVFAPSVVTLKMWASGMLGSCAKNPIEKSNCPCCCVWVG